MQPLTLTSPDFNLRKREENNSERFALSFCPCLKRMTVSVKRNNGEDYKHVFDEETSTFKPLNCVNCQPRVTEKDLLPIYTILDPALFQFVTFVHNVVTDMVEKYIFNPKTEQFEQVDIPELPFNVSYATMCNVLFTIDTEKGQVVIRKDRNGNFVKERFQKEVQMFVPMESIEVKTLPFEQTVLKKEPEKDRPRLKIQVDFFTGRKVIFVLKSRKLLSVHAYDNLTGQFYLLHSNPKLSEEYLCPKCVVFSKSVNQHVFYAMNGMTGDIEQFVYSSKTQGFEQVQVSDTVYDPSLDTKSDIILIIHGSDDTEITLISRNAFFGNMQKHRWNSTTLKFEKQPPVEVKFFSHRKEDVDLDDTESDAQKQDSLVDESTDRSVRQMLPEVTEIFDQCLEWGSKKDPSISAQYESPVRTSTPLCAHEIEKELLSEQQNKVMMAVDEKLEAEEIDSSNEDESSERGRTGDAESNESNTPPARIMKRVKKTPTSARKQEKLVDIDSERQGDTPSPTVSDSDDEKNKKKAVKRPDEDDPDIDSDTSSIDMRVFDVSYE